VIALLEWDGSLRVLCFGEKESTGLDSYSVLQKAQSVVQSLREFLSMSLFYFGLKLG